MTVIRGKQVFATERLYLDRTESKILREGDKDVAFLLAPEGGEIPGHLVERFGLLKEDPAPIAPPSGAESIAARKTRVPRALKER